MKNIENSIALLAQLENVIDEYFTEDHWTIGYSNSSESAKKCSKEIQKILLKLTGIKVNSDSIYTSIQMNSRDDFYIMLNDFFNDPESYFDLSKYPENKPIPAELFEHNYFNPYRRF